MIKMDERALLPALLAICVVLAFSPVNATLSIVDFNIQNAESDTNHAAITLYVHAVDGNKMMFSCDNSTFGAWVNYTGSYAFNLETGSGCSSGDGVKTVYAKVQDNKTPNPNQLTGSDSINLDTTGPTITSVWHDANSNDDNSVLNSSDSLIVRVTGEKDVNAYAVILGIGDLNLFDDGAHNDIDLNDGVYGNSFNIGSLGTSSTCNTYVVGKMIDRVQNQTTKNSFTQLCIDVNTPTYSSETPKNYTNDSTPNISIRLLDSGSGIKPDTIQLWVDESPISDENMTITAITGGYLLSHTPTTELQTSPSEVGAYALDWAENRLDVNWYFTIDSTAPTAISDLAIKIVDANSNDLNVYWSEAIDVGGSGLSRYTLYRYTSGINSSNLSSATVKSSTIAATAIHYIDDLNILDEDKTYYYAIKAVDSAGNMSMLSNSPSYLVPDINAPTDINFFVPYYVNTEYPTIKVTGTDVHSAKISCNDVNYSASYTTPSEITAFSITTGNDCTTDDGNKIIYANVFDNHDNNVRVSRSVYLDYNAPNPTAISETSHQDNNNHVSWAAATDIGGGISHYRVYYKEESGVDVGDNYVNSYDINYSHIAIGRKRYCYRIMVVDLAENVSGLSGEACQKSDSNAIGLDIVLIGGIYREGLKYYSDGNIEISISASASLKNGTGILTYTDGNSTDFNLTESNGALSAEIELKKITGKTTLSVEAFDSFDVNTSGSRQFYIDMVPPTIGEIKLVQTDQNTLLIKITASNGLDRLELFASSKGILSKIGNYTSTDFNEGKLEVDWNYREFNIGDVNILIRAFDDLNNQIEKNSTIIFTQGVEKKVERILEIRKALKTNIAVLTDYLLEPSPEIQEKLRLAEQHLENANKAMTENNALKMEEELGKAAKLLSEIEGQRAKVSVSNSHIISYVNEKDLLGEKISRFVSGNAFSESKKLWSQMEFRRELQFVEITENGTTEKKVLVLLYAKNSGTKSIESLNVVEKIPKELSESTAEISFNTISQVIEEDPVVAFFISSLAPGEEKIVKYSPLKSFSEEELSVIEENAGTLFKAPIPLPAAINPKEVKFGGTGGGIPLPAIVAIIAVLGVYLTWRVRREIE